MVTVTAEQRVNLRHVAPLIVHILKDHLIRQVGKKFMVFVLQMLCEPSQNPRNINLIRAPRGFPIVVQIAKMFHNFIEIVLSVDELVELALGRVDGKLDAVQPRVDDGADAFRRRHGAVGSEIDVGIAKLLCFFNVGGKFRDEERLPRGVKAHFPRA